MKFLFFEKPLVILMLIPILISIHVSNYKFIKLSSIITIFLYTLGNKLIYNKEYIELWIICIYLLFYIVITAKKMINPKKEQIIGLDSIDEDFIYKREFINDFNFDDFKNIFLKNSSLKRFNRDKKIFATEGGLFDKVYYFIILPKTSLLTLTHQKTIISYIKESSWIGIVEFISEQFDENQKKWLIGLELENPNLEEVVWLEWNKEVNFIFIIF